MVDVEAGVQLIGFAVMVKVRQSGEIIFSDYDLLCGVGFCIRNLNDAILSGFIDVSCQVNFSIFNLFVCFIKDSEYVSGGAFSYRKS